MTLQNPITPMEVLSREERVSRFGLDCGSSLEWRYWDAGGEYVKSLVIKNVGSQMQKVKYKLPQTKFFSLPFPETISLGAGMNCSIKVTFRPIEMSRYEDVISFTCLGGGFAIPIRAHLPAVGVVFSPKDCLLDYGLCAVGESHLQKLSLSNSGEVSFNYSISMPPDVDVPFKASPSQGTLNPQESVTLSISFSPREASHFTTTAICGISGISRAITLRAIAKYPFIVTEGGVEELNFGYLQVGRVVERTLSIRNMSQVRTTVRVRRVESDTDSTFAFSTNSVRIGAGESVPFKVTYSAATSGLYSSDTYELSTPGGNTTTVRCVGNSVGPQLVPSSKSINFGSVQIGNPSKRSLSLSNPTDSPATFEFFSSDTSDGAGDPSFLIEPLRGVVPARASQLITLVCSPKTPITFYKRVVCLVRAGVPFFVDLIATGFDESARPALLHQRHVDRFYSRRIRANALTTYPPEVLEGMGMEEEEMEEDKKDGETRLGGEMGRELSLIDPWEEFYHQNTHFSNSDAEDTSKVGMGLFGVKEVEVLESLVDFGACPALNNAKSSSGSKIEPKLIRVANRTNGKLTCVWSVSKSSEVEPPTEDIPPHTVQTFKVFFLPKSTNQFYGAKIECTAYYKTMRSFRLVVEKSITPPWSFFTTVMGHTYEQGSETFLPRVELSSRKIGTNEIRTKNGIINIVNEGFTSCHVGGAAYQIASITNTGDTSLSYRFEFPAGSMFSCHPSRGVLRQEQTQLVVFRFRPTSVTTYRQVARCILNNSLSNALPIGMVGTASLASVSFPDLVEASDHYAIDALNGNGGDEVDESRATPVPPAIKSSTPELKSSALDFYNRTMPAGNNNCFYFRLTCIGTATRRACVIRNPSRIPIVFQLSIPDKHKDVLFIEPQAGEILGNENTMVMCSFTPTKAKKYVIRVSFSVYVKSAYSKSGCTGEARTLQLVVVGEGILGKLELNSKQIDFGNVLIGAATKRDVTIRNTTACDVQYSLEWRLPNGILPDPTTNVGTSEVWDTQEGYDDGVSENGGETEDEDYGVDELVNLQDPSMAVATSKSKRQPVLEIVPAMGFIPAYSTAKASVIIRPRNQSLLAYKIICKLQYEKINPNQPVPPTQITECEVIGCGVFPFLQVTDVRSENVCRTAIWRWFNINALNAQIADSAPAPKPKSQQQSLALSASLSSVILASSAPTPRDSTRGDDVIRMDFGAAPIGTSATRVVLAISNPSPLPVTWRFSFRSELEAYYSQKREAWMTMSMMDDEVSDNMKRQKWMVENKIFRIKPKSGHLLPGETASVEISYSHSMITDPTCNKGYDELPVCFEIANGRQAVVCLRGRTLAPAERYLHFATSSHLFSPIPIGISDSPIQPYQLYNHGSVDVDFSFDLSALETMKKENYNFSVFECLTESGHIPAGGQFTTYWRFTPLEIKDYECSVALITKSGPTAYILFKGRGYNPTGSDDFEAPDLNMPVLPPPQPQLTMESQPVTLSLELLDLGTIPIFSLTRRLVVLHNTSSSHSASFSWSSIPSILFSSFSASRSPPAVEVKPEKGLLAPGEKKACCVIMRPNSHVGLLELEVPCEITLIVPPSSSSSSSPPSNPPSISSSSPSRAAKLKETVKKESMFPPIVPPPRPTPPSNSSSHHTNGTSSHHHPSSSSISSSSSSSSSSSHSTSTLFLILQARTLPTDLYRHLHGNYSVLHTPYPPKSRPTNSQRYSSLPLTDDEANSLYPIASSFLASLISEILADPDVQEEARQHDDDDVIPYFEQLREESDLVRETENDTEKEKEKEKENRPHRIERSNSDKISNSLRNLYANKTSVPTTPKRKKGLPSEKGLPSPTPSQRKFGSVFDVYKDADFAEVAEYVLEATIYNLMNEVLHGEFSLEEPPAVVFHSSSNDVQ